MMEIVAKYWVEWVCGIIAAALLAGFQRLHNRQKKADERQRAVELGVQALLRDRILQAYYHYSERNRITLEDVPERWREQVKALLDQT